MPTTFRVFAMTTVESYEERVDLDVSIPGFGISESFSFDQGSAVSKSIEIPEAGQIVLELKAHFRKSGGNARAELECGAPESIHITQESASFVSARVAHGDQADTFPVASSARECTVRCPDGDSKTGPCPCIDCLVEGDRIRICC